MLHSRMLGDVRSILDPCARAAGLGRRGRVSGGPKLARTLGACVLVMLSVSAAAAQDNSPQHGEYVNESIRGRIVWLAEAMQRHDGDRSRADFEMACVMLRAGDAPDNIAAALVFTSEKVREREDHRSGAGLRYAERTVQAAMRGRLSS